MTTPKSPVADEYGVLSEPKFVSDVPLRRNSGARVEAVRRLIPALKAKPNVWAAVVESSNRHAADNVRTAFRKGTFGTPSRWEVVCRSINSKHVCFVRYLGVAR